MDLTYTFVYTPELPEGSNPTGHVVAFYSIEPFMATDLKHYYIYLEDNTTEFPTNIHILGHLGKYVESITAEAPLSWAPYDGILSLDQCVDVTSGSGTQGMITDEQLSKLQASDNTYIRLNQKEIYRLNNKGSTEGIWYYTNNGYNNGGVTKYLKLILATKVFTITEETGGGGGGTAEVPVINMTATTLQNLTITDDIVDKMLNKGYVIQNTFSDGSKVIIRLYYVNSDNTVIHLMAEEYPDKQMLIEYRKSSDTNTWRFSVFNFLPQINMYEHKSALQYENVGSWVYVHSINTHPNPYTSIDEFVKYVPNFTLAGSHHSYQFMKMDRWDDSLTLITDGDLTTMVTVGAAAISWDGDNVEAILS